MEQQKKTQNTTPKVTEPEVKTPEKTRLEQLEERVEELTEMMTKVAVFLVELSQKAPQTQTQTTVAAPPKKGSRSAKQVRDTKTGVIYRTLGECGNALCGECGLQPGNWVWYSVKALIDQKEPGRLQIIG